MKVIKSLNETKVFFNTPAKDVFNNLGAIKSIFPLLVTQFGFKPETAEYEYYLTLKLVPICVVQY